eukprot:TRINITY_DN1457_c0_g1_i1.p1 TRINITY_DN1457_c0_g1~~TRINITY_DN1457_c0_g1_i1.p1  ORF type:complete len:1246 (-),score=102.55 TRINITY_DN1457_c0_g1_i1:2163-5900(-)
MWEKYYPGDKGPLSLHQFQTLSALNSELISMKQTHKLRVEKIVQVTLVCQIFLLFNIQQQSMNQEQKSDYRRAGLFSELFFNWINPLISVSFIPLFSQFSKSNDLTFNSLGELPKSFYSTRQAQDLTHYWGQYQGRKNRALISVLRCYLSTIFVTCFLQILCVVGRLTSPFLLQQIIDFIGTSQKESSEDRVFHGAVLLIALIFVRATTALVSQRIDMQQKISGSQSIVALGAIIYRKSLKLSSQSCKTFTQGKLMNLIQMDCLRVAGMVNQLSNGITLITTLVLSMYLLYRFLGVVALVGVGICIVSIVINYFVAKLNRNYQKKVMALKDERMKKTNETLQCVKILKMYGWCDLFQDFIAEVRKREISTMQTKACLSGLFICALYLFPKLVSIGTFFIYAAVYDKITLGIVFATINVFNIMANPLRVFPWYISAVIDAFVSGKRVQEFLESEEVPETYNAISGNMEGQNAIEINGCDFTWDNFNETSPTFSGLKDEIVKNAEASQENSLTAPLLEEEEKEQEVKGKTPSKYVPSVSPSVPFSRPIAYDDLFSPGKLKEENSTPENATINQCSFHVVEDENNSNSFMTPPRIRRKKNELDAVTEEDKEIETDTKSVKEDAKDNAQTTLALQNINLKVKKGEFVFIIGEIGSGKSSLLQSIIGDLKAQPSGNLEKYKRTAKSVINRVQLFGEYSEKSIADELQASFMNKSGKFAYVEQHPWIQNGTIKENIVFMNPFDEEKYKATLKLCELEEDIAIFPAGDRTEIGERGINLSGGQKARVSMARAVYSDRDIYLLDDPLSALDSNVKGKIFHNCIVGKLAGKTRILASHCIEFLDMADRIIVLDKGQSVFDGSYVEFMKNERFVALVNKIYLTGQKPITKQEEKKEKEVENKPNSLDKNSGKIIAEEEQEKEGVSFSVYKRYLSALGGVRFLVLLTLIMASWTFCTIGADYWLGLWAQTISSGYFYLVVNALLALGAVIFIVFRVLLTFTYSIRASKKLHESILSRIMGAPINLFFDTTPIGRIINRLSNDLHCVDIEMPFLIGNLQMGLWRLIGCLLISIILIYWCILPVPFIVIAFTYYLRLYLRLQRKLKRLEKVSRSPVLQFTAESYSGAVTIRAYEAQAQCIARFYKFLDNNMKCGFYITALDCWATLRIQLVSLIMNVLTVTFVVFFFCRNTIQIAFQERLLESSDGRTGTGLHAKLRRCYQQSFLVFLYIGNQHGFGREVLRIHRTFAGGPECQRYRP